jgi:Phosphatase
MTSPPPGPAPADVALTDRLVRNGLCGEVATPVGSCVGNCRRLAAGDADHTFGLSDWRGATFEDAVAAVEALGGGRLRDHAHDGPAFIDPSATLAGLRRHRDVLSEFVDRGGGAVLVATGHPTLLPHYGRVARALARAGCRLLQPPDDGWNLTDPATGASCTIAYVGGAGALFQDGSACHTHRPEYMAAMLKSLGEARPDLVIADHGFAGAAIEAGITTLSIADVNDPALALVQARGRTAGVLLIDDGLRPNLFTPATDAILSWA